MRTYRIIRNTEELSNGEIRHHYTVEFKSKFLWFSWWNEYGFNKWCGAGHEYTYQLMDCLTDYKFKHKTDAEKFIQELIDCEVNDFDFTPIVVSNDIRWIDKVYSNGTFSFCYDYETIKNKELEYREKQRNKIVIVKHTREVV